MKSGTEIMNDVIRILEKDGYTCVIDQNELWNDIIVDGQSKRTYSIRCNKRNSIVRVHYWMPIDDDTVRNRSNRLLQACDITNREMFLKARLFPEGIDIIYEIPERAFESTAYIVSDVLYSFEKNFDQKLFDLAVKTNEDLYKYYEEREKKALEEIRKRIEEHNKRRRGS